MGSRAGNGTRWTSIVVGAVAAVLLSGGVAAAATVDLHPEALPMLYSGAVGTIQSSGQSNWYFVPAAGDSFAEVDPISLPAGCDAQRPLLVSLYSPDGHWIQDAGARSVPPRYLLPSTNLVGRYLVQVSTTDPACVGARYRYAIRPPPVASSAPVPVANVLFCRADRKAVGMDNLHLKSRHLSKRTKARYLADLNADLRQLKSDRCTAQHRV